MCIRDSLKALASAVAQSGAGLHEDCQIGWEIVSGRLRLKSGESDEFDQVCVCAGAWSSPLLKELGIHMPLIPVRGQMLMFKLPSQMFEPVINEGSRYIVPRADGHVLVGSTTEEVGFDESTTDSKLKELQRFATSLVPSLEESVIVGSWAGLRPASHDGFPYMGALPGLKNGFVATGHFKAGLQVSPAVAVMLADCMEGRDTLMDLDIFSPGRLNSWAD